MCFCFWDWVPQEPQDLFFFSSSSSPLLLLGFGASRPQDLAVLFLWAVKLQGLKKASLFSWRPQASIVGGSGGRATKPHFRSLSVVLRGFLNRVARAFGCVREGLFWNLSLIDRSLSQFDWNEIFLDQKGFKALTQNLWRKFSRCCSLPHFTRLKSTAGRLF